MKLWFFKAVIWKIYTSLCAENAALWPQKSISWCHMQQYRVMVCLKHVYLAIQLQSCVCLKLEYC